MENKIKNWSVLGKGYENTLDENVSNYTYTYITKKFTGTEAQFNEFCNNLYNTIECWKEIESGIAAKPQSLEDFFKEIKETPKKNIKPKYKIQKRYKAPNFEDSFKEKKKPFRYIG